MKIILDSCLTIDCFHDLNLDRKHIYVVKGSLDSFISMMSQEKMMASDVHQYRIFGEISIMIVKDHYLNVKLKDITIQQQCQRCLGIKSFLRNRADSCYDGCYINVIMQTCSKLLLNLIRIVYFNPIVSTCLASTYFYHVNVSLLRLNCKHKNNCN